MNDATLLAMTDAQFRQVVSETLNLYRNGQVVELATSPLACSSLMNHYLLENEPWTSDNLHKALQSVLVWAIEKLRPSGQPDWLAPHWRNYNILFHFYLQGRTWVELSEQMFTSEQNISRWWRPQAIDALAQILKDELLSDSANNAQIKQAMLANRYSDYATDETRQFILHFLSIFRQPISGQLLYQQAQYHDIASIQPSLRSLFNENIVLADAEGFTFWLRSDLVNYIRNFLSATERLTWHQMAGHHYLEQQHHLEAAYHFYQADSYEASALILVDHYRKIIDNFAIEALQDLLSKFRQSDIDDPNLWARLKIVTGQVVESLEDIEVALDEYRLALQAPDIQIKALAYYRRAKAFRYRNSDEALAHYNHGIMLLEEWYPEDRLLVKLYADRAWIFLQERQDLQRAEADLTRAQTLLQRDDWANRADLYNALGELFYHRNELQKAVEHRVQAWVAANEVQDIDRMVRTSNNVGQDYAALEEYDKALEYLESSVDLSIKAGDKQNQALGYKAIGACFYWLKQYNEAIQFYKLAQEIFIELKNRTWLASVGYDLAEGYAKLNDMPMAKHFFDQTLSLAQEIDHVTVLQDLDNLAYDHPFLIPVSDRLNERQQQVLVYVKEHGQITNRLYRDLTGVSQKQAARDLNELVELGLINIEGKGRGTRYISRST